MWQEVEVNSNLKPSPRRRTTLLAYQNKLYAYGGYDVDFLGGFYSFDLLTKQWTEIKSVLHPNRRSGHSSIVLKDSLYIIGGETSNTRGQTYLLNDVWKFDFKNNQWELLETEGIPPSPRFFHSLCPLFNHLIILFGGFNRKEPKNDFFYFDTETYTWNSIPEEEYSGDIPSPMLSHCAVGYLNSVFVYGGAYIVEEQVTKKQDLYEFNFYTKIWRKLNVGSIPPRSNAVSSLFRNFILFFGGFDEESAILHNFNHEDCNFFNDLHIFDITEGSMKKIENLSKEKNFPKKRTKHSGVVSGDQFYVFGGVDGEESENLNDLCCTPIPSKYTEMYMFFEQHLWQNFKNENYTDVILVVSQ